MENLGFQVFVQQWRRRRRRQRRAIQTGGDSTLERETRRDDEGSHERENRDRKRESKREKFEMIGTSDD